MPRYHEQFRRPIDWLSSLGGLALVAVPGAAGLYRGSLEWMDVVTAMVGFALLCVAAYDAGHEAGGKYLRCS